MVNNKSNAKDRDFNRHVLGWWQEYLDECSEAAADLMMEGFIGEEETVEDYIPEDAASSRDWLKAYDDADVIYSSFFGFGEKSLRQDDMPETEEFLSGIFKEAAEQVLGGKKLSFVDQYVSDMAYHASEYTDPAHFFTDLQHGCQSGMIGMLIYNSDCKEIYVGNIDDMEEYVEGLEEELGEPIRNRQHVPHYTFICWLCYEALGDSIARTLFPNDY